MKTQKEVFLSTEGDQWFSRNKKYYEDSKDKNNIIIHSLTEIEIKPKKVLEIGCSNGIRLNSINKAFGSTCYGIDPSIKAIEYGNKEFPNLTLQVGTADSLSFDDNSFDLIIFGFCLYLCDRKDLFKIAFEADRCLSDNGFLVILDFYPPFPFKNTYAHKEGIYSYKMDYSKLFSCNPAYNEIFNLVFSHTGFAERIKPDEKVAVTILNKSEGFAYPLQPYKERQ